MAAKLVEQQAKDLRAGDVPQAPPEISDDEIHHAMTITAKDVRHFLNMGTSSLKRTHAYDFYR